MIGAQQMNLAQQTATQSVAADDDPDFYTMTQNNGYDGTVQVTVLPPEFETQILKNTNGIENSETKTAEFAMMVEFDGDQKRGRHIFWHCVLTKRPDITGTTKDNNLTVDSDTINIKAVKRKDGGDVKAKVYENWAVYNTMFTAVPAPADVIDPDATSTVFITGPNTVEVSGTIELTANVTPAGTAVTWSSLDTANATVDGNEVTGVAEGTATIKCAISSTNYATYVINVVDSQ